MSSKKGEKFHPGGFFFFGSLKIIELLWGLTCRYGIGACWALAELVKMLGCWWIYDHFHASLGRIEGQNSKKIICFSLAISQ